MRTRTPGFTPEKLFILVMGLTGAGKSTFISILTGNNDIPIGMAAQMSGVTQAVQDYILPYQHKGTPYEIHLIDSPGFDDGSLEDAQVLSSIADFVNTTYKLKERLAGLLYLHDITKTKVGGVALCNIRMLEEMIGGEKFNHCTLVTSKWGCTTNPQDEEDREKTLRDDEMYFGHMLQNGQHTRHASMRRFDPKTYETALDIILPYLDNEFVLQISRQMVDPKGPRLALGDTGAGKVVASHLEARAKAAKAEEERDKVAKSQAALSQKYDEALFLDFKQKRKELRRKIALHRTGRWIMRTTIMGGAIAATVLTLGPGASAFALEPVYEKAVKGQRKKEKEAKILLAENFKKNSQNRNLKAIEPDRLWDTRAESMVDLTQENARWDRLLQAAKVGATVSVAAVGEEAMLIGEEISSDIESEGEEVGWDFGDVGFETEEDDST
ncbi:MAG: hypothetical protein Q9220_005055 [cf. Caloplaca sp. 1 TL-2023]